MDILARRKIHHGVGAPLGGPFHFFHFLIDRRCHGRIPDIGIDLHEEVSANNHRLILWVVDIAWNDGPPRCDFIADELRCDHLW